MAETFATLVQEELVEHGGLDNRGVKEDSWTMLTSSNAPGAMTFVGFLDNSGDGAQMSSNAWRQEVAKGFMHAIQRAFNLSPYTP